MSLPAPPFTVVDPGEPEQDQHGNTGAFIRIAEHDERVLLRMKGMFPVKGDVISDRVLEVAKSAKGNEYLKLVKPQKASQNGSQRASQDGPDEAYWAGQNAAKGRAHAQEMALRYHALQGNAPKSLDDLRFAINWFQEDAEQARDRAVEEASQPVAAANAAASPPANAGAGSAPPVGSQAPVGNGGSPPEQPTGISTASSASPTEKQTSLMIRMARERGLDGPAMKRYLKSYLGVEQFSQLPKSGCVDSWIEVLKRPDPEAGPDIPVDDWPPTDLPAPSDDSDDRVPF